MDKIQAVSQRPVVPSHVTAFQPNYIQRIVELVAKSLALQTRTKTNERTQIEELKSRYEKFSKQSGELNVTRWRQLLL